MKPTNASAPEAAAAVVEGFRRWNTPVPYLFIGIAAMLCLIALALIMLACSNCNLSSSANSSSGGEAKENSVKPVNSAADTEPKIVVIMAGEDNPTFLAKPAPASTDACLCQQV